MICSLVLLTSVAFGTIPAVADTSLADQFGRTDRLSAHRGNVAVAFIVSARRLREVEAWEKALREQFDDLEFVRVADVDEERDVSHEDVASKLRKRVPEDVSVLIDVQRRWASELVLDTSHTNVLVFDASGKLRAALYGKPSDDLVAAAATGIRSARGDE